MPDDESEQQNNGLNGSKITSRQQITYISLSSAVAAFDFFIYFFLAETMSAVFFPHNDSVLSAQLQLISVLCIGFLARPIGGLLLGRYGDLYGRKAALLVSTCFLVVSTLVAVCLPTYAQVGIIAPILFISVRVLQGMAFGAHAPLGWIFIAEHAPKQRVATYCSVVTAGVIAGMLAASVFAMVLTQILPAAAMLSYGWRIPAMIGGVLSILVVLAWRHIQETPVYTYHANKRKSLPHYLNILPAFDRKSALLLFVLLAFIQASLSIIIFLLLPQLVTLKYSINKSLLINANLIALGMQLVGCVVYGIVADKIGIGKTFVLAAMALIFAIWIFYVYLAQADACYVLCMYGLLGFSAGMVGLCVSVFVQLFPTGIRLSAVSMTYNTVVAILGAALPYGLYYATDSISFAPALYLTFVGLLAIVVGLHLHQREIFGDLHSDFTKPKKYCIRVT